MRKKTILIAVIASCFVVCFASSGMAQCQAPDAWFPHESTPKPNDNADFNSNCEFHQWSWQMFLWLTQPTGPNGELRFETMQTPSELFGLDEGAAPKALAARKVPSILKLTARVTKTGKTSSFDEINQAGSRGLLIAHNNEGNPAKGGRAVYFSQHINDTYYNFVRSNKYYVPEKYEEAPEDKNFPVGSLELKASWRIVENDTSGLYTRMAQVSTLTTDGNGNVVVDPKAEPQTVRVTLVGLHVVGVVKDHPEFIWATFEHVDNAPVLPDGVQPDANTPVSDRDWTFYTKNTVAKDCNVNNAGSPVLDAGSQHLHPITQVFLQYKNGGGDATNQANIESLNASVQGKLAASSPWNKFRLDGAIWMLPNSLKPGGINQNDLRGSLTLSNATMETFTQDKNSFRDNCFKCHTSGPAFPPKPGPPTLAAKNMNISHIMTHGYFENKSKAHAKAAASKKAMFLRLMKSSR